MSDIKRTLAKKFIPDSEKPKQLLEIEEAFYTMLGFYPEIEIDNIFFVERGRISVTVKFAHPLDKIFKSEHCVISYLPEGIGFGITDLKWIMAFNEIRVTGKEVNDLILKALYKLKDNLDRDYRYSIAKINQLIDKFY